MKRLLQVLFTFWLLLWNTAGLWAQCATCKGQLEGEGNESMAQAVNQGILYLLAMPFLLVAIVGMIWWVRSRQMKKEEELRRLARMDGQVSAEKLYGEFPPSTN